MLALPPVLTHAAAPGFVDGLKQRVQAQPAEVVADAGALQTFDSSALAVLLECRREALAAGKAFSVQGLPARLRQLANLYGVAELMPATA
ncbi:STAS domain-containing protein [Polaromonas jejuensis]|uniref:Lipid asymmetry maintenance protein MlaB n=1 Tax=Polaromonas jejuensis TaxID=457502 RepID=A0ABW0QC46_9BURK|nr:STAS domain-containing protein [Polaromonas jejuensis]